MYTLDGFDFLGGHTVQLLLQVGAPFLLEIKGARMLKGASMLRTITISTFAKTADVLTHNELLLAPMTTLRPHDTLSTHFCSLISDQFLSDASQDNAYGRTHFQGCLL